jgi:hypothetical protein
LLATLRDGVSCRPDQRATLKADHLRRRNAAAPVFSRATNGTSNEALALPEIKTRLHNMAAKPPRLSPAQFESFSKAEVAKWAQLVQDTNL